ncbi:MAG: hypothetical protein ACRDQ9_03385 [Pseudonocardiaceae bacterium]
MTAPSRPLRRVLRWHRPLVLFVAAMALLVPVALVGLAVDDRVLVGAPIWLKPLKFALSFTLYGFTLAWMLSLLRRGRQWGARMGTVVAVAGVIEMLIIIGQVLRGRQSHFNGQTTFDTVLFFVMGATITVLWTANLVIAVLLLRDRLADRLTAWAIRLGLLVAAAGMAVGFLMVGPTAEQRAARPVTMFGAHTVGAPDGGPGLPLTGWSTTAGDLRVPHFVGMHALQVLPLFALALAALAPRLARLRDERARLRLVLTAAVSQAGLVAVLLWQALRGQSLMHPDAPTVTGFAAVAVVALGGTAWALSGECRVGAHIPVAGRR